MQSALRECRVALASRLPGRLRLMRETCRDRPPGVSLSLSLSLIHPLLSPTGAPCRTRWRECDAPNLIGVRLHTAMGRRAPVSSPSSPRLPTSSTMTFDSDIMQITISLRALIFASNPPQDGERAPGVPAAVAPSDLRPEDILAAMLRN
jgi:hypothetical protein